MTSQFLWRQVRQQDAIKVTLSAGFVCQCHIPLIYCTKKVKIGEAVLLSLNGAYIPHNAMGCSVQSFIHSWCCVTLRGVSARKYQETQARGSLKS